MVSFGWYPVVFCLHAFVLLVLVPLLIVIFLRCPVFLVFREALACFRTSMSSVFPTIVCLSDKSSSLELRTNLGWLELMPVAGEHFLKYLPSKLVYQDFQVHHLPSKSARWVNVYKIFVLFKSNISVKLSFGNQTSWIEI